MKNDNNTCAEKKLCKKVDAAI